MADADPRKQLARGCITHAPTNGCGDRRDTQRDDVEKDDTRPEQVDRALADDHAQRSCVDIEGDDGDASENRDPSGMSDLKYHR